MTLTYCQISNNAGSNYYYYDVRLTNTPVIPIPETPSESSATLNGESVISFGATRNTITLELMVYETETRSGYADLARALGLFSSTTAAANNIRVRLMNYDTSGTTYQCVLTNKTLPPVQQIGPDAYGSSAVYSVMTTFRVI